MKLLSIILLVLCSYASYAQDKEDTLPALKVKDVAGKEFKMNALKGKVTFMRMWKSYEPSVADLAFLEWMEKQYGQKIQYVYLCTGEFTDAWKKTFARFPGVKGMQLVTIGDQTEWDDFLDGYSQIAIVGRDGQVYYQNEYQFEDGLQELLK